MKKPSKKTSAALGAVITLALSSAPAISHAADLFQTETLSNSGYMVLAGDKKAGEGKCGEGKCGEGKCGGDKKKEKGTEGKCGEGKCGEGTCGGKKK